MTSHQKAPSHDKFEGDNYTVQDILFDEKDVTANTQQQQLDNLEESLESSNKEKKIGEIAQDISSLKQQDCNHLRPDICWAQTDALIVIHVFVCVRKFQVTIDDSGRNLQFSSLFRSDKGIERYYFSLELHSKVRREYRVQHCKKEILINLSKLDESNRWPRLLATVDEDPKIFDPDQLEFLQSQNSWTSSSDSNSNDSDCDGPNSNGDKKKSSAKFEEIERKIGELKRRRDSAADPDSQPTQQHPPTSWKFDFDKQFQGKAYSDIFNPFNRRQPKSSNMKHDYRKETTVVDSSKNTARHALDCKKTYLFLYNLMMFIVFLMVYIVLIVKTTSKTIDDDSVQGAALIIKLLTYTQLLESVHPMLGLVPGGPLMPFTQVVGRLLVNHFLSEPTIRLESWPYAHYLFIVWTSIEIFRYSFYALRVFKVNIYPLTWCRYTLFLPLYPLGGFCESMVIMSTIKFYESTGGFSVSLPNAANFSFSLPIFLRIYTFIILGPTIYMLMKYMWRQRSKQLKEKVA